MAALSSLVTLQPLVTLGRSQRATGRRRLLLRWPSTPYAGAWRLCQRGVTLLLLLVLVGCGRSPLANLPAVEESGAAPTQVTPPLRTTVDESPVSATEQGPLVLWVPGFFSLDMADNAGALLLQAAAHFERAHPGVRLIIANKAESGSANMLTYLRTAQRAAPSILPDAVIMHSHDLWRAVDSGLLEPIERSQVEKISDLYPFALEAIRYGEAYYGLPFCADIEHLVYHSGQVSVAPTTWAELLTLGAPYLFTAGVRESPYNDSLLLQIVGAGGQLNPDGSLSDPDALEAYFNFLVAGRANGVIPNPQMPPTSPELVWTEFAAGEGQLANVSARYFLRRREVMESISFAPVPTQSGRPAAIAQVWALAMLTSDPVRQALIADLMDELLDPALLGPWSQFAHRLPVRRSAFAAWNNSHPYYQFLSRQLEIASAIPPGQPVALLAQRLQLAARQVLAGELTPTEALQEVQATP